MWTGTPSTGWDSTESDRISVCCFAGRFSRGPLSFQFSQHAILIAVTIESDTTSAEAIYRSIWMRLLVGTDVNFASPAVMSRIVSRILAKRWKLWKMWKSQVRNSSGFASSTLHSQARCRGFESRRPLLIKVCSLSGGGSGAEAGVSASAVQTERSSPLSWRARTATVAACRPMSIAGACSLC